MSRLLKVMPDKRPKPFPATLTIRIPQLERLALNALAKATFRSRGATIRAAIRQFAQIELSPEEYSKLFEKR